MRRFSKVLAFSAACSAALILTVSHGVRTASASARTISSALRPARRRGKYDLGQLPDLLEDAVLRPRELLRQEPARSQADAGRRARLRSARRPGDPDRPLARARSEAGDGEGERAAAQLLDRAGRRPLEPAQHAAGDLQVRAAQPAAGPEKEEARRLVEIEMAATNGMLYTLDPHSVLLDVETYKDMRTADPGEVRRSRHRDRDGQEEPHHGQAPDAGHARDPRRHQGQGSHRPHQQRVDRQHDA